jgi:hypothetical protein
VNTVPFFRGAAWASSNLSHVAQLDGAADAIGQIDEFQADLGPVIGSEPPDWPDRSDAEGRADIANGHWRSDAGDANVDFLVAIGKSSLNNAGEVSTQIGLASFGVFGIGLERTVDDAVLKL